ncbi:MAG: glycosyltransferase family 4 protein [Phycisphaerales bacterium]
MNRLVTDDPGAIDPAQLPPARRGDRLRLLFITSNALGFKTLAGRFEAYTAARDDVEAVHLRATLPPALELLGKVCGPARGWDLAGARRMWLWSRHLSALFRNHLPADRFDAAVITTQGIALGMPRVKAATGLPYAVYLDTTAAQYVRDLGGSRLPEAICRRWERRIFDDAEVVAGMSRWSLDSVHADYRVPRSRLLVVHNAVPVPATLPPRPDRGPGDPVRLAIVGNDWVRKGGDRLVKWHQARWKGRAELHVFGSGVPTDHSLEGIVWHGRVEHARLTNELLPAMDVFVLPTRQDMSPWAIVEAASCGLPVVSSRIGAIHEIVEEGRTGFLCDPADDEASIRAVERLMADPELRRSMGRAAHANMLAEFSPDRCYGALIDRLASIAAAGSAHRPNVGEIRSSA